MNIKDRCRVDEFTDCWIWTGATSPSNAGKTRVPRVWATDYSADPTGATKTIQTGNRAAWHATTRKPIAPGHRVYRSSTCGNLLCVNPDHLSCGSFTDWGKAVAKRGTWKGSNTRIQANRAIGRKRSHITAEMLHEINHSNDTGQALSVRLGVRATVISKARRGEMKSWGVANPFSGLMK